MGQFINRTVDRLVYVFFIIMWVAGIVIAKGFGSTFFAVIIPLWAWYLVIELFMTMQGWIV